MGVRQQSHSRLIRQPTYLVYLGISLKRSAQYVHPPIMNFFLTTLPVLIRDCADEIFQFTCKSGFLKDFS